MTMLRRQSLKRWRTKFPAPLPKVLLRPSITISETWCISTGEATYIIVTSMSLTRTTMLLFSPSQALTTAILQPGHAISSTPNRRYSASCATSVIPPAITTESSRRQRRIESPLCNELSGSRAANQAPSNICSSCHRKRRRDAVWTRFRAIVLHQLHRCR
jgi:hypothetical protein